MTTVLRVYVPGGNHQGKVVEVGCIRLHLAVMTVSKVPCLTYLAHIVRMVVNNFLVIKIDKVVMPMGV